MATRRLRNLIQQWVPVGGALVIVLAVLLGSDAHPFVRVAIAMVGILIIEAGVWKVATPLLPNDRKYLGLRAEVDDFILLVRALNRTTLEARATGDEEQANEIREILDLMHSSVDLMAELAGTTEEEMGEVAASGGPEKEPTDVAAPGAFTETDPPGTP